MNKLQEVKTLLKKNSLDAFLVSSIPNIVYLTGFSAFSTDEREAFLLITRNNQYVFTDTRYSEAVKRGIPSYTLIEHRPGILTTAQVLEILRKEKIKNLGFESSNITVEEYERFKHALKNIKLLQFPNFLEGVRIRKEKSEIDAIAKACAMSDRAFDQILKQVEEGVSETKLAVELEYFIKKQNAEISFRPIVAFSENAALPHHKSTNIRRLKKGDLILFDFGAKLNNYCSDMTRTIFFGEPNSEFRKMYETVRIAQEKAIEYLKSLIINHKSIKALEVDKIARSYIIDNTYPSMPHSLGHGIGVQVHEAPHISPNSEELLQEGMVFSIEPGIYFPDFGGVRIEDLVVLEKSGPRLLTNSPKELIEL